MLLRRQKDTGPDDFTFKLIKDKWDIMMTKIIQIMKHFEVTRTFSRHYNSSFMTLIPKVVDSRTLGDYLPISLIGCMYKIMAKLLAMRIK